MNPINPWPRPNKVPPTPQPGPVSRLLLWLADRRERKADRFKREAELAMAAHDDYRPLLDIPACPECKRSTPEHCDRHARQLKHRTQELQSLAKAFQNS